MDILDRHFIGFSAKRKTFLLFIAVSFLIISISSYYTALLDAMGSFFLFLVGILFVELLKLQYRIEDLEHKKKK